MWSPQFGVNLCPGSCRGKAIARAQEPLMLLGLIPQGLLGTGEQGKIRCVACCFALLLKSLSRTVAFAQHLRHVEEIAHAAGTPGDDGGVLFFQAVLHVAIASASMLQVLQGAKFFQFVIRVF